MACFDANGNVSTHWKHAKGESTEKVGRGAILPFFLLITYGHSQLSIIGGVRFFVAGGVRAFGGEALVQVADFVVVLLKKKGGLFV
ncbi:MAG: hypothetical protein PUJ41_09790 [Bacteroidales bacterium]|nr:hypothetical protein [Bacteroidales bacterium]MDY4142383.1 hypothetical protein [Sodaliphilus sp.]